MKIIVPGKIPDPNVWEGLCQYCKCQFECNNTEVERHDDQREQTSWTTASCPTCNCSVHVSEKRKKRK